MRSLTRESYGRFGTFPCTVHSGRRGRKPIFVFIIDATEPQDYRASNIFLTILSQTPVDTGFTTVSSVRPSWGSNAKPIDGERRRSAMKTSRYVMSVGGLSYLHWDTIYILLPMGLLIFDVGKPTTHPTGSQPAWSENRGLHKRRWGIISKRQQWFLFHRTHLIFADTLSESATERIQTEESGGKDKLGSWS